MLRCGLLVRSAVFREHAADRTFTPEDTLTFTTGRGPHANPYRSPPIQYYSTPIQY